MIKVFKISLMLLIIVLAQSANAFFSADVSDKTITVSQDSKSLQSVFVTGTMNEGAYLIAKVLGPQKNYKIMEKVHKLGMWASARPIFAYDRYSFYKLYSTHTLYTIAPLDELSKFGLTTTSFFKSLNNDKSAVVLNDYMAKRGLYNQKIGDIEFVGEHFYKFEIPITQYMTEGEYIIDIYSFGEDHKFIDHQEIYFSIFKTSKWQKFKELSISHPLVYAILTILLAVLAGLIAGVLRNGAKQH